MVTDNIILQANNISKSFDSDRQKMVIADISLTVHSSEIVTFLGMSGTGKSTFLRIIAGLAQPNNGNVICCGKVVNGPSKHISMVFQNFALLPWLTVFENVAFGLEALGIPNGQIHKQTMFMMNLIGLDGYENTPVKNLSGGMKQRVGFARALALEPDVLLLDEAFSALDVYTSQRIRQTLMELWSKQIIKTKAMIVVTHNVEEAIMMSNRILIWGGVPANIKHQINIDMPWQERTKRNMLDKIEEVNQLMHQQTTISEQHGKQQKKKYNNSK
jgi:NitT/TauT family transport system ATP-binding protein